jgi:acyl-[acyl-carrier-protein]-phospholipid O-acyltransferase / long-chain-fatty-acid--[acyl-carrier-protein] ligase
LLAVCGGFYSVPLYTSVQTHAAPEWRARMVAANNVVNAVFMVCGAVMAAGLASLGMGATQLLTLTAAVNLLAVLWSLRLRPSRSGADLARDQT